jgi:hypothetical protein
MPSMVDLRSAELASIGMIVSLSNLLVTVGTRRHTTGEGCAKTGFGSSRRVRVPFALMPRPGISQLHIFGTSDSWSRLARASGHSYRHRGKTIPPQLILDKTRDLGRLRHVTNWSIERTGAGWIWLIWHGDGGEAVGGATGISVYSGPLLCSGPSLWAQRLLASARLPLSPSKSDWFPKLPGPNPHDRRDITHEVDGDRVRASGRYARRVYG